VSAHLTLGPVRSSSADSKVAGHIKALPLRLTARMSFVSKICSRCWDALAYTTRIDVSVVRGAACQYADTRAELFPRRSTMITKIYA
jgi:hypothetical protein